jgi:hypothetical protein
MSLMLNTLVLTAHITGDKSFLEPLRTMAAARLDWIKAGRPEAPAGSRLWCGANLDQLSGAIAKYRFATGDNSLDALLRQEREASYVQYRLAGRPDEIQPLVAALETLASSLRINFAGYTQEVRFTDRVLRFPLLYQPGWMLEKGVPATVLSGGIMAMGLNRVAMLYNAATGDPGDPLYFPLNAVRWRTPPRDIAALVTDAAPDRLAARIYHFGAGERTLEAELLLLEPGTYRFELTDAATGRAWQSGAVTIAANRRRIGLKLPPRRECGLRVMRQ